MLLQGRVERAEWFPHLDKVALDLCLRERLYHHRALQLEPLLLSRSFVLCLATAHDQWGAAGATVGIDSGDACRTKGLLHLIQAVEQGQDGLFVHPLCTQRT